MSPIRATLQQVFLECLHGILRPLVQLTLRCGLGHSEFSAVAKSVFIDVASEQYGIRGRPANAAKISARTGLSRKAIQKFRSRQILKDWSPDEEVNPVNTIIHYWRFDERFCISPGIARDLALSDGASFSALVKSCVGDIPPSTIRQELLREGIARLTEEGNLQLVRNYSFPEKLDEDFLRNAAFSLQHHAETLLHNALMVESGRTSAAEHRKSGRFERIAWSRRLDEVDIDRFQLWVREHGSRFVEEADEFISKHENSSTRNEPSEWMRVAGVGLYFFRN